MKKKKAIYRTDLLPHGMNAGKEAQVRALLSAWRRIAVLQAREQWRLFFTTGKPNKRHDAILEELVSRFSERFTRPKGGATDPRLSNPYFRDWAAKVTLTGPG